MFALLKILYYFVDDEKTEEIFKRYFYLVYGIQLTSKEIEAATEDIYLKVSIEDEDKIKGYVKMLERFGLANSYRYREALKLLLSADNREDTHIDEMWKKVFEQLEKDEEKDEICS